MENLCKCNFHHWSFICSEPLWLMGQAPRVYHPVVVTLLYTIKSICLWLFSEYRIWNLFNIDLKMRDKLHPQSVLKVGCSIQRWHDANTGGAWQTEKCVLPYYVHSPAELSVCQERVGNWLPEAVTGNDLDLPQSTFIQSVSQQLGKSVSQSEWEWEWESKGWQRFTLVPLCLAQLYFWHYDTRLHQHLTSSSQLISTL